MEIVLEPKPLSMFFIVLDEYRLHVNHLKPFFSRAGDKVTAHQIETTASKGLAALGS